MLRIRVLDPEPSVPPTVAAKWNLESLSCRLGFRVLGS